MEYPNHNGDNNRNTEGYKVPGDGNAPNAMPAPRNKSFEENPHKMTHKDESDIPGKEFNTSDKAFSDSSKKDFVETVSSMHHAEPDFDSELPVEIDLRYKKPDGDR